MVTITNELLEFLKILHFEFEEQRQRLLKNRVLIQNEITSSGGKNLKRPKDGVSIENGGNRISKDGGGGEEGIPIRSNSNWSIKEIPNILKDRSVDIVCLDVTNLSTLIECVESGANGVQVDFDDGYSPSFENSLKAQSNINQIVNNDKLNQSDKSLLIIRPRSMNLDQEIKVPDSSSSTSFVMSGSLFDLGIFLYLNGKKLIERGRGPFLYIPKIENFKEAIWWNSILERCEELLELPKYCIKAIVLIENILASFEMEEIIYYLRDRCIALNTGRWDYIFSYIKKFSELPQYNIPNKSMLGFNQDFLLSYYHLLSMISHKRGCLATGGMAPHYTSTSKSLSDKDLLSIYNGKRDEAKMGFDGALVAHPSAVKSCRDAFNEVIGKKNNINNHLSSYRLFKFSPIECESYYSKLINICDGLTIVHPSPPNSKYPIASVSTIDVKNYLLVLYNYISNWIFKEKGALPFNGVIEDLATSEINRVLLWKWLKYGVAIKEDNNKLLTLSTILNYLDSFGSEHTQQQQQHQTIKIIIIQFLTSNQLIDFMPTLLYPYLLVVNNNNKNNSKVQSKL